MKGLIVRITRLVTNLWFNSEIMKNCTMLFIIGGEGAEKITKTNLYLSALDISEIF